MQQTVTITWTQGSESIPAAQVYEADSYGGGDYPINTGVANGEIDLAIETGPATQVIFITSDQDVTIKTNSSTVPQETINLKKNTPIIVRANAWPTTTFAGDITKLFVTNASGATALVRVRFLTDLTP